MKPEDTRALIRGKPDTCRMVVEAHYAGVYQSLCHLCNDRDLAADLTQETFVQAWQSLHTVRNHASVGAWLRVIAARTWWNFRKSRRPHADWEDMTETLIASEPSPSDALLAQVEWEQVACAIRQLPDNYRTLVVLHHLEQLTHREIADVLSLPVGTVKSRLFEAMRRLRRTLVPLEVER